MIDPSTLVVGQRVVARSAFNRLLCGTVAPVPRDWRRADEGPAYTTKGDFPKVWVRFRSPEPVPWPAEDVFTDIGAANAAVAHHERAAR